MSLKFLVMPSDACHTHRATAVVGQWARRAKSIGEVLSVRAMFGGRPHAALICCRSQPAVSSSSASISETNVVRDRLALSSVQATNRWRLYLLLE